MTIAVVFIQHGLNDTYVPWQYGQVVQLQQLGRQWKSYLPFNIYNPKLFMITKDLFIDQDNGHWISSCILDLNQESQNKHTEPYNIMVDVIVAELKYIKGASSTMLQKIDKAYLHRPSSIVRHLQKRGIEGDTYIDVQWCESFLKAWDISKDKGSSVYVELENIQTTNAKEQDSGKVKTSNVEKNSTQNKDSSGSAEKLSADENTNDKHEIS